MHRLNVTVEYRTGHEKDVEIAVGELVLLAWSGRTLDVVRRHQEEVARIGVPQPKNMPEVYVLQPYLITTSNYIKRISEFHTGEVEYVLLIKNEDEIYVTVGSDHTDREAERCSVLAGKHMYPKVVARKAWPLREVLGHWDELILRSWVLENERKTLYQEGSVRLLIHPTRVIDIVKEVVSDLRNIVVFSGTIPTLKGQLRVSPYFEFELHDPVLNRSIKHYYWVE